ncbi:MAG: hypothetical protein AAGD25_36555 [Cyanobacteria bacterium P01_F01_bin.150]
MQVLRPYRAAAERMAIASLFILLLTNLYPPSFVTISNTFDKSIEFSAQQTCVP